MGSSKGAWDRMTRGVSRVRMGGSWRDDALSPEVLSGRGLALLSGVMVTLAYLSVLHSVIVIVGVIDMSVFLAEVLLVGALTVWVSRSVSRRTAAVIGSALVVLGFVGYLVVVPAGVIGVLSMVQDVAAFLTGLSVLQIIRADVWVLGFVPGPLFVSWYCFLRREYGFGAVVAGSTVGFFLLTGDMGVLVGVIGAVGVMGVVGFGRIDREAGSAVQRDTVVVVLVIVTVVTMSVSFIPGGQARTVGGSDDPGTVEGSLFSSGDRVDITGSVELSPEVRFTVTAPEAAYWRTGAYDRYTGSGWVRTGRSSLYTGPLSVPESPSVSQVSQSYQVEADLTVMPAAWKPVGLATRDARVQVSSHGALQPIGRFTAGDQYSVQSAIADPPPGALRMAGTGYPGDVQSRYTQVPESTPASVERFTTRLTSGADTPYGTAVIVEEWLATNKAYSLDVERPEGDIAAGFLFEMDAGYCTYFATAMVTMLRTQDIPARFVTGYSTGQQVGANTWVARGFNSHAWVEVYFPGHGWVAFDPTPSGPRDAARADRLTRARTGATSDVDTALSAGIAYDSSEDAPAGAGAGEEQGSPDDQTAPTPPAGAAGNMSDPEMQPGFTPFDGPVDPTEFGASDGGPGRELPSGEVVGLIGVLAIGLGVSAYRSGVWVRGKRAVWVRRVPDGPPRDRVIGLFSRMEYVLAGQYRARRIGESRRAYLESVRGLDDRVDRAHSIFERAYYGDRVSEADAAACEDAVRGYLADHVRWYWGR